MIGYKWKIIVIINILMIFILCTTPTLALDKTIKHVGIDLLYDSGIRGDNFTICLIDTGIDYTHPALGGCTQSQFLSGDCEKVVGGYDFGEDDNNPIILSQFKNPNKGHGTNIAGILISDDNKFRGVAPNAKLVVIKVDKDNETIATGNHLDEFFENVVSGMQWCIDNGSKYNIKVISMSLGYIKEGDSGYDENDCPDDYGIQSKINEAIANDIMVVVASGNDYHSNGIATPACLKNATAIGSSTVRYSFNDLISLHTNRGTALDLLAPGSFIYTTKVGGGFTKFYESVIGTSFATPHVAGVITLIKQYDPAMKANTIESLLEDTGKKITDYYPPFREYPRIDLANALGVLDWPTFHHDYRRTGFTLLKGDIDDANEAEEKGYLLSADYWDDVVTRPSIGDLDNDGKQEVVVVIANSTGNTGWVMSLQKKGWTEIFNENYMEKWKAVLARESYWPPTIGDIEDGDDQKEVAVSLWNGTLLVLDGEDGAIDVNYGVEAKNSTYKGTSAKGLIGNAVIADLDYDGDKEIIFADYRWEDVYDWPGELYIIDKDENLIDSATFGNGGAQGAISVANIDDDDNLEIIVPSWYGVFVYDFDGNSLTEKWNNSDGLIEGSVVIYDVDRDNEYELIYVTNSEICSAFKTCNNRLYIRNAKNGSEENKITFSEYPKITSAVGNVDDDPEAEIVTIIRTNSNDSAGKVYAFDYDATGPNDYIWRYPSSSDIQLPTISPDIVDINGDGTNDVLISIKDSNQMVAIDGSNGTELFTYEFDGEVGSAFAIGDIRDKGIAAIAVKHAGSPVSWFSSLTGINEKPHLNTISNITAIEGELIDLNSSGEVLAIDEDNNTLNFTYSSPFNSSGLWQTTINDSGNYSILIEVNDGNLSDYLYVDVKVFKSDSFLQNNFSDGSSFKGLDYSGSENQSVTIRLLKNATILYAQLKAEGFAP